MAPKSKTAIHVVLDTNSLFTEAADKLLAHDIGEFIVSANENIEVDVHWYLPWIVKAERHFQMMERAKKLLPHLQKIERLLGHQLGITEEILQARVEEAIKKQVDIHRLTEITFDPSAVNWQKMVERSVLRKPPFDPGETEKGFRDAILLESFCQLAANLPKTAQLCRVALLSNDELLLSAARERLVDRPNIAYHRDLEAVKTMLNALASELTQEMVSAILPKASALFFTNDDNNSLYYKAEIRNKISEQFSKTLLETPEPGFSVKLGRILVSPPTFLTKARQTLTFANRIRFNMEGVKREYRTYVSTNVASQSVSAYPGLDLASGRVYRTDTGNILDPYAGLSHVPLGSTAYLPATTYSQSNPVPTFEETTRSGEHVFEVTWSVTLTSKGSLTNPRFLKIEHIGTTWGTQ